MNKFLICLLIGFQAHFIMAQETNPTPQQYGPMGYSSDEYPSVQVGVDLNGMALMSIFAAAADSTIHRFRPTAKIIWRPTGVLFLESMIGYESAKYKQKLRNVNNYRSAGTFLKFAFGVQTKSQTMSFGIGYFYSSFNQTGIATFGGEYFQPGEFDIENRLISNGTYIRISSKIPLSDRMRLEIELDFSAGRLWSKKKGPFFNQAYLVPGVGKVISNGIDYGAFTPFFNLLYRL
ncbi:hypothetical protein [Luteibaculum oceani]|uniref:DUF3575 domain-containing protein n=1 Tax=Luteibaculum oceani TaxID=1294296 RepID=A0A5C6URZ3_9FLAO|nr:hypothetical protein [Luteibaculum oceani]TXC76082.1 hypothetical protein FRX97_11250 [Luteibaculum oceani]